MGSAAGTRGRVRSGLDRLVHERADLVRGKRVGLLVHHASFTSDLVFAADALERAGAQIVRLFGPEHGVWGAAQDMIPVGGGRDRFTGREVVSLYGEHKTSLRPDAAALAGLDVVVIDLQDVGSRYYTYVATAAYVTEVAHSIGVLPIVCDRPNPIGGAIEGNRVAAGLDSFVGAFDIPQRHGMTLGELVQMTTGGLATVVPMSGWERRMWFDDTGLPWFPPSPNMPSLTTAAVYPGLCLIEGTDLSEGRGTTTPFEVFGAPYVQPFELAQALGAFDLPGVGFRPHVFQPTFQKWAGQLCGGVQIVVHDREALQPVRLGLAILSAVFSGLYSGAARLRTQVYEYEHDRRAIDLLLGDAGLMERIAAGEGLASLTAEFADAEARFRAHRAPWLLYD